MSRLIRFTALSGLLAALAFIGCGPQAGEATLTLTANPRSIVNDVNGTTSLSVEAVDGFGKPGTGTVTLSATAGTVDATTTLDAAGKATSAFTCNLATDAKCHGSVKVTATWTPATPKGAVAVEATASITVNQFDAGFDAGPPKPDAGTPLDAGVSDGGYTNAWAIGATADKLVLLEGTTDFTTVTATLKTNTSNPLPGANKPITFTARVGSFDRTSALLTKTVTADATGTAQVQYYVATATGSDSPGRVVVTAEDAQATAELRIAKAQSLTHDKTDSPQLNIKSTQIGNSTNVQFLLKDGNGMAIPGVDVTFELAPNSAAGSSLAPAGDRTNTTGIARTTLFSGDAQGTAIVTARVTGLAVDSPAITIIIGRPSDQRLSVDCTRKSLGARQNPAGPSTPRNDQGTTCTASGIADRNGNKTPYQVAVNWQTEVGSITSSQAAPGAGVSTTNFTTAGMLPVPTTPFPGEPSNGADNPRDSFVTIIAIVDGEEQFWDGSGSSNGVANGKWDPGEWWVDLPEPFVDSNDNGTWDPGEPFTDTDRINCATGLVEPKNQNWDGPNGCWDSQTKIWRATHVVYTDGLVGAPTAGQLIDFSSPLPTLVPVGSTIIVGFRWYDRYFNRLSNDGPGITLTTLAGMRGSVVVNAAVGGEAYGHDLRYVTTRGHPLGGGTFSDDGDCEPLPADAGDARCLRGYRFVGWKTSATGGTMTFTNPSAQVPLSDGGTPAPTPGAFELRGSNSLQANPSTFDFNTNFQ